MPYSNMPTRAHTCMHIRTHARTDTHTHRHTHMHACTHKCACMFRVVSIPLSLQEGPEYPLGQTQVAESNEIWHVPPFRQAGLQTAEVKYTVYICFMDQFLHANKFLVVCISVLTAGSLIPTGSDTVVKEGRHAKARTSILTGRSTNCIYEVTWRYDNVKADDERCVSRTRQGEECLLQADNSPSC